MRYEVVLWSVEVAAAERRPVIEAKAEEFYRALLARLPAPWKDARNGQVVGQLVSARKTDLANFVVVIGQVSQPLPGGGAGEDLAVV